MATSNFKLNSNTKNIYAYCMMRDYINDLKARREDDGEEYDPDAPIDETDYYFWFQDEAEYIESRVFDDLCEKFGKLNVWRPNDDRRANDREAAILCAIETTIDFAGYGWPVQVQVTTRPGYYDGGQLDIELRKICWDECYDNDDRPDDSLLRYLLINERGMNEGMATILAPKLQKRLDAAVRDLTEQVDEVLANCASHKLGVTERFSNGETWFDEVA